MTLALLIEVGIRCGFAFIQNHFTRLCIASELCGVLTESKGATSPRLQGGGHTSHCVASLRLGTHRLVK